MELLRRNDSGDAVRDVQDRLAALGYACPRDGAFDAATEEAVRAFQDARGLTVDGIVGPDTLRTLAEASWSLGDRVLYLRSPNLRGDDVREVQDRLLTLGFDAWRVDGIFGPRTAAGVRDFQRNIGLPDDGIVAQQTVRALAGLPRITGDTPSTVVREREALRQRPGSVVGMRIVLDPGHGGDDPGQVAPDGAREADICFHIVRRVESSLGAGGAQVYVTRPQHDAPDDRVRAALANVVEADLFVSVHVGQADGARAYYFGHERYHSEGGKRLAELLLEEARADRPDLGAHAKTFSVLRETRMTAVSFEVGRIDDPSLTDHAAQTRIAESIAEGIRRFAREPVTV